MKEYALGIGLIVIGYIVGTALTKGALTRAGQLKTA